MQTKPTPWVIKPLVPEPVYTDRTEFLEYFHHSALEGAHRRTMSKVLLGQRRMGKTEIFKRVVNRLFFEQNPRDPHAVVPVYYCFRDQPSGETSFATDYMENFIRYYVGFLTSQPELIIDEPRGDKLLALVEKARALYPFTRTLNLILDWYDSVVIEDTVYPQRDALWLPRRVSDIDDSTIAMFLDEFQNTRLPQYAFEIVGFMQEAVESPTCPHFVTGSAMSILSREIIGRGSLFGRFRGKDIKALSGYWGAALARRAARYYKADITELMAPVIANRCGGNPFYITAVIQQAAELNQSINSEESLNRILAVDISSGFIWGELNDQVARWIERINEHGITKQILYLSALDENTEMENKGRLNVERIRRELKRREGRDVAPEAVKEVLIKLSRGDLVEYLELGGWFRRIKDPILLEFLKVWGRIEVDGHQANQVQNELVEKYMAFERRVKEYKGYLAEVHITQVLLNGQRKVLPGAYFNSSEDIQMPDMFFFVRQRYRFGSGKGREIDVIGAAGPEQWVCQSKWIEGKKIGVGVLKALQAQADQVKEDMERPIIRKWLFANHGLTAQARIYAQKHGILWSARAEFDKLLQYLGLRPLPNL